MPETKHYQPAYLNGLAASNRLTDARSAIWQWAVSLPAGSEARRTATALYKQVCGIQGAAENLLVTLPTFSQDKPGDSDE